MRKTFTFLTGSAAKAQTNFNYDDMYHQFTAERIREKTFTTTSNTAADVAENTALH